MRSIKSQHVPGRKDTASKNICNSGLKSSSFDARHPGAESPPLFFSSSTFGNFSNRPDSFLRAYKVGLAPLTCSTVRSPVCTWSHVEPKPYRPINPPYRIIGRISNNFYCPSALQVYTASRQRLLQPTRNTYGVLPATQAPRRTRTRCGSVCDSFCTLLRHIVSALVS